MAGGKVRAVLCSLITDNDHLDGFERSKAAKDDIRKFLTAVVEKDSCMNDFDEFASNLVKELERCFFTCVSAAVPFRSKQVKREKLWSSFHRLRVSKINVMWNNLFLRDIGNEETIPKLSPLVYQSITQQLYSDIINCHLGAKLDLSNDVEKNYEDSPLTRDEENILRYVAGYVPFKLLLQYEKSKAAEAVSVVECLSGMAVNGEESDALAYTSKWIELINRGGVFEVSDTTYMFFKEIELKVRKQLLMAFERNLAVDSSHKDSIICAVAGDESVQFYWTLLSVDISSECQAVKVLKEIIGLWVNIRGFSIANSWLAKYSKTAPTTKNKALRKELKRKYTETKETE